MVSNVLERTRSNNQAVATLLLMLILVLTHLPSVVHASKNTFEQLDIQVRLNEDGSATFREDWHFEAVEGTEIYKVMNTENIQSVDNYQVYFNGKPMNFTGNNWNVNSTKQGKAMHYGSREYDGQTEYNVGITEYGSNIYTFEYDVTNFVHQTTTDQMIFWQFVGRDMSPAPEKVTLKLESELEKLTSDNHKIWAFGYDGLVDFTENGAVYAESDKPLTNRNHFTLLIQIPDNTYPTEFINPFKSFEEYKEEALIGSSYSSNNGSSGIWRKVLSVVFFYSVVNFVLMSKVLYVFLRGVVRYIRWRKKWVYYPGFEDARKELGEGHYFRELPEESIFVIYAMLNDMEFPHTKAMPYKENRIFNKYKFGAFNESALYENYFTAALLYFVKENALVLSEKKTKFLGITDTETILTLNVTARPKYAYPLYRFLLEGATEKGERNYTRQITITQLSKYIEVHYKEYKKIIDNIEKGSAQVLANKGYRHRNVDKLMTDNQDLIDASKSAGYVYTAKGFQLRDNIIGFYNYLHDFSLLNERGVMDVHLWDEYMLFAAAFGLTDKLAAEFDKVHPDYKRRSNYVRGRRNRRVRFSSYSGVGRSIGSSYRNSSNPGRSRSGSGGRSSRRGGRGSSGGGRGGGSR